MTSILTNNNPSSIGSDILIFTESFVLEIFVTSK